MSAKADMRWGPSIPEAVVRSTMAPRFRGDDSGARLSPRCHSNLAPVAVTTGPHFACSALMNVTYSAGVVGEGTASWVSNCFFSSADCNVLVIALCSLSRMSGGTPAGAEMPYQLSDSTDL